ncbi:hypothetical protein GQ43DRAFT_382355 [Delitschia confertaspora ATCC 74209]|uniref:RING-type domain-containing protein n=1 Tax=Delitschia confertaspora ATCC 74209 TaxID=1513339 RepID=A0A9P4JCW5_9PLEO|nr:hypothetical protein GQ43DRAFT_382355 [Delitschia confertaspora ATCC 74209]
MEFALRCNDLKCRSQLHERAVVTTCSHVFCVQCSDSSGLSRTAGSNRICPACGTQLSNPDDVVVAGLNPTEDYKTSVLSGLSPSIIMECATRGLAFYSYQASQEIIYEEHLAKSLTDKYTTLSQQMDQLIHEANAQIKLLQNKLQAIQEEQGILEQKNHELVEAFREKSRAHQNLQKVYQTLKAQSMVSQVENAADNEAAITTHTARPPDQFVNRIPGARTGTAATFDQFGSGARGMGGVGGNRVGGRYHNRGGSGSSGEGRSEGIGLSGRNWPSQVQTSRRTSSRTFPLMLSLISAWSNSAYLQTPNLLEPPH